MTRRPMSGRRHVVPALLLLLATAACCVLALTVSVWLFVPAPLLLGGALAAWLGMTPARFFDAVDDPRGGAGFPF